MIVYAFDVDETLEVAGGPVPIVALEALRSYGHVVGLCGNWALAVATIAGWPTFLSFVGPMEMSKAAFLRQIKTYMPADDYVMVGNIRGVSGASDDAGAAAEAGWRFLSEATFAAGGR